MSLVLSFKIPALETKRKSLDFVTYTTSHYVLVAFKTSAQL